MAGIRLAHGTILVGRSQKCGLQIPNRTVSRCHAEISVSAAEITVTDLNSRNGTFVDGHQVVSRTVRLDRLVRFGSVSFQIVQDEALSNSIDSEIETQDPRMSEEVSPIDATLARISGAQRRVLDLLMTGLSEKQVASQLDISQHTVHNHAREIYRKMGAHSRSELFVRMRSLGRANFGDRVQ